MFKISDFPPKYQYLNINGEFARCEVLTPTSAYFRLARKASGFTPDEAAERAGIAVQIYNSLESGEVQINEISESLLIRVCNAVNLDPLEFLSV